MLWGGTIKEVFKESGNYHSTTNTSWSDPGGAAHRFVCPPLHHPPGTTPWLVFQAELKNGTAGETAYARVDAKHGDDGNELTMPVKTVGTSWRFVQKMRRLAGPKNHFSTGDNTRYPQFGFQMKTTTDANGNGTSYVRQFRLDMFYEVR